VTTNSQQTSNNPNSQKNKYVGIGVDYGTSNSTAAIFDGERVILLPLERQSVVMPSATYVTRQFKITTGQDAIDQYILSNTGRKVELSAEVLGEGRTTTGQIGDKGLPEEASTQKIYGQAIVDSGQKGRLFRGIKRLLGSDSIQRLMVFDRAFRLVALITPLLLRIRQAADACLSGLENQTTQIANHACIGHPVNFEGKDEDHNTRALERLSESYLHAGFEHQSFYPEPVAAALSYLHANPRTVDESMLAVDFGGGTLDLCVLQRSQYDFSVVATHGIGLGGDHIDQTLFRKLLFPLLGKGERWRRAGEDREIETLFPFEEYEDLLLNWAVSYMLNQNKYTTQVMNRMEQGDAAAEKFSRLYELIKRNYSYLVFQCLKELKATLSEHTEAILDIPELDIELLVSRAEFETMIADQLNRFAEAVNETLSKAQIKPTDINIVIRTGGSSLIPAVRQILDNKFSGKVVEHDPFTSVAAGLAIAEYRKLGSTRAKS